jgi:hypothetical protein
MDDFVLKEEEEGEEEEEGGVFEMEQTVNIGLSTPFTTQLSDSDSGGDDGGLHEEYDEDEGAPRHQGGVGSIQGMGLGSGLSYTRQPMQIGTTSGVGVGPYSAGGGGGRFLSRSLPVTIPKFAQKALQAPVVAGVARVPEQVEEGTANYSSGDEVAETGSGGGAGERGQAFIPPHTFVEQQEQRMHTLHVRPGKSLAYR